MTDKTEVVVGDVLTSIAAKTPKRFGLLGAGSGEPVTPVIASAPDVDGKGKKAKVKVDPLAGLPRTLLVYTDGGCKPSRGVGGWGIHGYIFVNEIPKQGSGCDQIPTNLGYVESMDFIRQVDPSGVIPGTDVSVKNIQPITLIEYVDGYGSLIPESTNNEAEVTALFYALTAALERGVAHVHVMADSEYTIKGFTEWSDKWRRNNWVRPDGTAIANSALWAKVLDLRDQVLAAGIQIKMNWVRGHNNNFGNDIVDNYATSTIIAGRKGEVIHKLWFTEAKGYWRSLADHNRMLSHPYWYFNTHTGDPVLSECGRHVYYLGDHGTEDDFLGKQISDAGFSVVFLKEQDRVMEVVRNYQDTLDKGDFNSIVIGRLTTILQAKTYGEMLNTGSSFLHQSKSSKMDIYTASEVRLTNELRPPRIAFRVSEALGKLEGVLCDMLSAAVPEHLTITDITDLLYEENTVKSKSVTKLLPSISSATKRLPVDAGYNTGKSKGVFNLSITLGLDVASRNTLSALADFSPKVRLVTWRESDVAFRYATVIETTDDAGIWASIYSNICLIPS